MLAPVPTQEVESMAPGSLWGASALGTSETQPSQLLSPQMASETLGNAVRFAPQFLQVSPEDTHHGAALLSQSC